MFREAGYLSRKTFCLALLLFFPGGQHLFARVWTDRQGRQVDAQFVRLRGDNVVLQKGLKPLVIPLKEFCDEDQEHIKELTKGKGGAKSPDVPKGGDAEEKSAPSASSKPIKPKTTEEEDPFLTDAEKSAKTKASGEANPFLTDAEKAAEGDAKKTAVKPQGEKVEPPKINAEGGFDARTWTDRQNNKLTASFVRLEGKTVVLLNDGREQRYPLDEFTYNDKLYIRQAALELQKYQKFAGNRQDPLPQPELSGQGMPSPMGGAPSMSPGYGGGSPFQGISQALAQQQAEASRRAQEALAAEQERARQAEAARQQQLAEQDRQRQEQQRLADMQRQNFEQQRIAQQQARNMQTPSMPVPPAIDPTPFSQQMVATKYCMKCNKPVSNASKAGDKCPHCGVIWDVEEDEKGKVVGRSVLGNAKAIAGLIVLVIIGIGGLLKLFNR